MPVHIVGKIFSLLVSVGTMYSIIVLVGKMYSLLVSVGRMYSLIMPVVGMMYSLSRGCNSMSEPVGRTTLLKMTRYFRKKTFSRLFPNSEKSLWWTRKFIEIKLQ